MHDHDLELSLVVGHPFGLFDCAGLQYECTVDGCEYRELETHEKYEERKLERQQMFCGSVFAVARRGCTCGRATEQEIEDMIYNMERFDINADL